MLWVAETCILPFHLPLFSQTSDTLYYHESFVIKNSKTKYYRLLFDKAPAILTKNCPKGSGDRGFVLKSELT